MPKFVAKGTFPRKSNASTPGPAEDTGPTLADRLNYHDVPRPFKNPHFATRLAIRTASSSTTGVKKNVKQILTLERERVSGGDGFLSALQMDLKAKGEPFDLSGKKKKAEGSVPAKRGANLSNLHKKKRGRPSAADLEGVESGTTTPGREESGDEDGMSERKVEVVGEPSIPRKEVFTYHTPTAPPSLLPAKKYCDITGLHAAYTDPRTKLRYKDGQLWHVVRGLGPGADQAYLALRGAQTSLK